MMLLTWLAEDVPDGGIRWLAFNRLKSEVKASIRIEGLAEKTWLLKIVEHIEKIANSTVKLWATVWKFQAEMKV